MVCKNKSVRLFWIFFSISLIELSILWKTYTLFLLWKTHETLFQMLFIMFLKTNQADTFLNCLPLLRRIRNRKEWNINNIKEHKLKQFVSKSVSLAMQWDLYLLRSFVYLTSQTFRMNGRGISELKQKCSFRYYVKKFLGC